MAGLKQITNGLAKASGTAIEGNLDVPGVRMAHGIATGVFVTAIEMKQSSAFEQFGLKQRFWSR